MPVLNDYLPSDGKVFELQSSTVTTEDLSSIYDLSLSARRMRNILQMSSKFEFLNMRSRGSKNADESQQPKASLIKLLRNLSETLSQWVSERSYALSDAKVYSFHCLASDLEDLETID